MKKWMLWVMGRRPSPQKTNQFHKLHLFHCFSSLVEFNCPSEDRLRLELLVSSLIGFEVSELMWWDGFVGPKTYNQSSIQPNPIPQRRTNKLRWLQKEKNFMKFKKSRMAGGSSAAFTSIPTQLTCVSIPAHLPSINLMEEKRRERTTWLIN